MIYPPPPTLGSDDIVTLYFRSWQYLVRGWLYRDAIFSPLTIFGTVRGWLYRDIIFSLLMIFGEGGIILWHYIFAPEDIWSGGDYIVTQYSHPWQYLVRGWLYRDIIFSLLIIFGEGVIISWHYVFTPDNIWWGGDYIVTLYFHSWQYLVWGWLYCDIIFLLPTIIGEEVIILWHHIFTSDNISWGGDYIMTWYSHPWQYLVRGVIISWHYIFTPDNISWGGDYIMRWYSHPWQYLVRGVIISWHYIFTSGNIWSEGDYTVTLYFHSWQYLVWGWL